MNTLSILASFGALVWIFQDGNLSALFGTQPLGFVESTQPVILFCMLFGLSMDYEVFLLTRMREAWERTGDNPRRRARAWSERPDRHVGGADRRRRRRLVRLRRHRADQGPGPRHRHRRALDATLVRALLVPATMRLLGRWNWWFPGRLRAPAASRPRRHRVRPARWPRPAPRSLSPRCGGGPILANPPLAPVARRADGRCRPRPPDPIPSSSRATTGRTTASPSGGTTPATSRPRTGAGSASSRSSSAPSAAVPPSLGLAPRAHRRGRAAVPLRAAQRDRPAGRSLAPRRRPGRRPASTSQVAGLTRSSIAGGAPAVRGAWRLAGSDGTDAIEAALTDEEAAAAGAAFGLDLDASIDQPAALHDGDGFIYFGPAGSLLLLLAHPDGGGGQ